MSTPNRKSQKKDAFSRAGRGTTRINNVTIDKAKSPQIFNILRGTQILAKKGYARFDDNTTSTNRHALSLLDFLGASVCIDNEMATRDFSLIATQTDETIINNPNIQQDLTKLQPDLKNLDDKFKNVTDAIYTLDDAPPHMNQVQYQRIREENLIPNVVLFTSNVVVYNLKSIENIRLKYLK